MTPTSTSGRIDLDYHLPTLGSVRVALHQESADLYRFLEVAGEIDRLKRLDHLGLVRYAWDGAHHPRWEYALSMLNLIERCKQSPEVTLSKEVRIAPGTEMSSGSELLKSWALLMNIGHLDWTFSAERALLLETWRDRLGARKAYLAQFPRAPLDGWAREILQQAQIYRFFHPLVFFRLKALAEHVNLDPQSHSFWNRVFASYVSPAVTDERVLRMKQIYRNLRRIAFLTLDSHYTPAIVNVDLVQILSSPETLGRLAILDPNRDADDLRGIERHLNRDVYLGRPVIRETAARERNLRLGIRRTFAEEGFHATVEALAQGSIQRRVAPEDLETVLRAEVAVVSPLEPLLLNRPIHVRRQQDAAERAVRSRRTGVRPIVWSAVGGRDWLLQLHVHRGDPAGGIVALRYGFEVIADLHQETTARLAPLAAFFDQQHLHTLLFEQLAAEFLLATLNFVFRRRVRWEWQPASGGLRALVGQREEVRTRLRRLARSPALPQSRRDEFNANAALLRRRPTDYVIAAEANLRVFPHDGRDPIGEFDGVFVEIHGDRLELTLLEAKRAGVSSVAKARRQLTRIVTELKPKPAFVIPTADGRRENGVARVWSCISLG